MLCEAKWPASSWVNDGGVKKWLRWGVSSHELGWRKGCTWFKVCLSLVSLAALLKDTSTIQKSTPEQFFKSPGS